MSALIIVHDYKYEMVSLSKLCSGREQRTRQFQETRQREETDVKDQQEDGLPLPLRHWCP